MRIVDGSELVSVAEQLKPAGRPVSTEIVRGRLERPGYNPEKDLFLADINGEIVGYMDVERELAIERVILDCWIQPEYRKRGLTKKLYGCTIYRAQELGARVAHVNIAQDNTTANSVLSKLDFKCVRRYLELKIDMSEVRWQEVNQDYSECRQLMPGDEDKLTEILNRSFAGAWGYNPNTVEEVTHAINSGNYSMENVVLICHGEQIIGYCWTEIIIGSDEKDIPKKGRIFMLGVDPNYRGQGAGKRVLLAGLNHLKNKDVSVTELTVDSENSVARELYQSIGFKVSESSLWYEKVLE